MAYTSPSITASGTTFAQFQAGGASGHMEKLIAANSAATLAPTAAPTLAASGSGNTLPAATYYVTVTETNGIGETTNGSQVSAGQAITSGQLLTVTFAALKSGNTARNVYGGTASAGPFTLVATGITASTLNITAPLPSNSYAVNPPAINTTGLTTTKLQLLRYLEQNDAHKVWDHLRRAITNFNQGEPGTFQDLTIKLRDAHVVFSMVATLCAEAGTLLDANAGTLRMAAQPGGNRMLRRTWP